MLASNQAQREKSNSISSNSHAASCDDSSASRSYPLKLLLIWPMLDFTIISRRCSGSLLKFRFVEVHRSKFCVRAAFKHNLDNNRYPFKTQYRSGLNWLHQGGSQESSGLLRLEMPMANQWLAVACG